MQSNFERVREFHEKFGLEPPPRPTVLSDEVFLFRLQFIMEETLELLHAHRRRDLAATLDALVDILYVTYGLGAMAGMPLDSAFQMVHAANMRKVRASGADDPRGRRSSAIDVVKPAGWQPADLELLLRGCTYPDCNCTVSFPEGYRPGEAECARFP